MDKLISYLPPGLPLLIDVLNLRQPLNAALLALLVVLTLRVLLPAPPFAPPPYALSDSSTSGDYHWRPATHPKSEVWRKWTTKELRGFDGTDPAKEGGRILFAIRRKVYDVSSGRNFYGPGGPYAIFAGRDASRGLAKQSFEADMLTPVDEPIDSLDDLTSSEWDNLKDWERESCFFASGPIHVQRWTSVLTLISSLFPPRRSFRAPLFFLDCSAQNTSRPNTSFAGAFVQSPRLHAAEIDSSPSTTCQPPLSALPSPFLHHLHLITSLTRYQLLSDLVETH
ncbi:cytochrome b5-like heme/steroid binding domain-containing protein [Rhodotorula toruloides]